MSGFQISNLKSQIQDFGFWIFYLYLKRQTFLYFTFQIVKRHLVISKDPIDEASLTASRRMSSGMGAVVCFSGVVRESEGSEKINAIDYEAFQKMAEHQFHLLFDQMEQRWPVESVRLVHRVGVVAVGEPSLWVEIIAPNRA